MKTFSILRHSFVVVLAAFSCTGTLALAQDPAADAAFLEKYGKTFEIPGEVSATDFVPAEYMTGSLHIVRPMAVNNGLDNTYFIETNGTIIEVTGTPELLERVREIYALNYLNGVSKTDEFKTAFAQAAKQKLESVGNAISDPVGTAKQLPKGASRFFGRIGESLKGEKGKGEGNAIENISGISKAKAAMAMQLGVDPYTDNQELQKALDDVAKAKAGGGLILNLGTAAVPGGVGMALTMVNVNQNLQETLVNSTPSDLRIINRKKLLALGVNRELADQFLAHPSYSPWESTITTEALAKIGVNPTVFLTHAVKAASPEDGTYFLRIAQILAKYSATAPIHAIRTDCGIITALDKNGVLVIPVSLDYAIWAERAALRMEQFETLGHAGEIKGFALWTDGRLSDHLCEELKKRNIAFQMHALDASPAQQQPAVKLQPFQ